MTLRSRLGMLGGIYGAQMPYHGPHTAKELEAWLVQAEQSGLIELRAFARGLRRDREGWTSLWRWRSVRVKRRGRSIG